MTTIRRKYDGKVYEYYLRFYDDGIKIKHGAMSVVVQNYPHCCGATMLLEVERIDVGGRTYYERSRRAMHLLLTDYETHKNITYHKSFDDSGPREERSLSNMLCKSKLIFLDVDTESVATIYCGWLYKMGKENGWTMHDDTRSANRNPTGSHIICGEWNNIVPGGYQPNKRTV